MSHAPLCQNWSEDYDDWCLCPVIAKVREDMLAQCIAQIEMCSVHIEVEDGMEWLRLSDVLDALNELQEKP